MRIKNKTILTLVILFSLFISRSTSAVDISLLPAGCVSKEGCSLCDFLTLFINASNILVALSGTFAILMFVMGGMVMITAYGNDARVKWGKDILIATVTGIVIVLFAWTLVNVIIGSLFGGGNKVPAWADLSKDGVECP